MSRTPKFYMPDGDIITDFRQAKDQTAQIEILADLNCVSREQMREKLRELGLLPGGPPPKPEPQPEPKPEPAPILPAPHKQIPARPPMDELRAMELFNEGLEDLAIAEALGETVTRVKEWRRRMHLLRPRGGASEKQKQQRAAGTWKGGRPTKKDKALASAAAMLVGKVQQTADRQAKAEQETPETEVRAQPVEIYPDELQAMRAAPASKLLTVEGLARMLDTAAKLGGTVELQVAGQPLRGAEFLIRCGADGEPEHTVLRLEI